MHVDLLPVLPVLPVLVGLLGILAVVTLQEAGDRWRFNVFRIKRPGGAQRPQRGAILAAWSPVPDTSFHVPERVGWMEFSR